MVKKLESLTPEQEALIPVIRDRWRNQLTSEPNYEEIAKGITWIYGFANLKSPDILIVESPLAMQIAANLINNDPRPDVDPEYLAEIKETTNALVQKVNNEGVNFKDLLKQNGIASVEYFSTCYHGSVFDYGWLSFYEFFEEIGLIDNSNFRTYKEIIKQGIYSSLQYESLCIVCVVPDLVYREDVNNNLHATNGPAIRFRDGFQQYFLHGVYFSETLFDKTINRQLSFSDIMAFDNIEQRQIAIQHMDVDELLNNVDATLIDESERGNQLYLIKHNELLDEPCYYLKYSCPSTGRVYLSGINNDYASKNPSADACMAWKYELTPEEYKSLENES